MSPRSRARAASLADTFGLSRRSAREMYNRGTFRPFARDPEDRVPDKIKGLQELRDAVFNHFDSIFTHELSWETGGRVRFRAKMDSNVITHRRTLRYMATAPEDEIRVIAEAQPADEDRRRPRGLPAWAAWLQHGGYFKDHVWQNPMWYH